MKESVISLVFLYVIILIVSIILLGLVIYVCSTIDFSKVSSKIYNCWSIILCIGSCTAGASLFLLCCLGTGKCKSSGAIPTLSGFIVVLLLLFATSAVLVSEYSSTVDGDANYKQNKIIASSIIGGTSAMIFISILVLMIVSSYSDNFPEEIKELELDDNEKFIEALEQFGENAKQIHDGIDADIKLFDSIKCNPKVKSYHDDVKNNINPQKIFKENYKINIDNAIEQANKFSKSYSLWKKRNILKGLRDKVNSFKALKDKIEGIINRFNNDDRKKEYCKSRVELEAEAAEAKIKEGDRSDKNVKTLKERQESLVAQFPQQLERRLTQDQTDFINMAGESLDDTLR